MAWPINTRYQNFIANTTRISAAFLNDIQDKIYGVIGGGKTLKAVHVDGTGDQASTASAGDVKVSGNVLAPSGNVTAGLTVTGGTIAAGSGGQTYSIGATPVGYVLYAQTQTTNASTSVPITFTVPTNKAVVVSGQIVGYKSDHTNAETVSFTGFGAKDAAGVLTQFSSGTVTAVKDDATWGTSGPAVTANLFIVNINGKAATTINWTVMVWINVV